MMTSACEPCQQRARDAAQIAVSAARIARLLDKSQAPERRNFVFGETRRGHTTKPR